VVGAVPAVAGVVAALAAEALAAAVAVAALGGGFGGGSAGGGAPEAAGKPDLNRRKVRVEQQPTVMRLLLNSQNFFNLVVRGRI
jgi:hypothetical protein